MSFGLRVLAFAAVLIASAAGRRLDLKVALNCGLTDPLPAQVDGGRAQAWLRIGHPGTIEVDERKIVIAKTKGDKTGCSLALA